MMSTLTVSIIILLLCNCISLDTTALTTGPPVGSSAYITQCTSKNLSRCIVPDICELCKVGLGPPCAQATCVNGQCGIISPCSQTIETTSTTPPTDACTSDSQCPHPDICELCKVGLGPTCAQGICVNGQCGIISPCSQTIETTSTTSTTPPTGACTRDGQCPHPDYCIVKCPNGGTPGCASAKCVNGKCIIIAPCSQTIETTSTTSTTSSTSTTPPTDACTRDGQCPHPDYCVAKCPNGGTPGCASAKCVHGKCIIIAPCSE